jgi:hypothetical protein
MHTTVILSMISFVLTACNDVSPIYDRYGQGRAQEIRIALEESKVFERCWSREDIGFVEIRFYVSKDGNVPEPEIETASTHDVGVGECLKRELMKMRFSASDWGKDLSLVHRFESARPDRDREEGSPWRVSLVQQTAKKRSFRTGTFNKEINAVSARQETRRRSSIEPSQRARLDVDAKQSLALGHRGE